MVSSSAALGTSAAPARSTAWLHGPWLDVLFGYGLAYVLSVPLLIAVAGQIGPGTAPVWIGGALALLFSTPHYGATLLRVYERRSERRRYAFFTVWVTLALAGLFALGLHDVWTGSLLLTAYVTWSPWHFSGQNYGLAVMYLRRRGVELPPDVKRPLYTSFVLSAALSIVAIHLQASSLVFAAGTHDVSQTFRVLQLGIPRAIGAPLALLLAAAWAAALAAVAWRLRGRLGWLAAAPVALLVLTQALWFSVAALGTSTGAWHLDRAALPFAAIWISSAHAVQYLWVTSYFARRGDASLRTGRYLGKTLLAGTLVAMPALLFVPGLLGPWFRNAAGVGVLMFSVVNLHHFLLDGAIWKLRDGRVARALIRSDAVEDEDGDRPRRRWLAPLVVGVGTLGVLMQLYSLRLAQLVADPATPLPVLRRATAELAWLGLDTPKIWGRLGQALEEAGEPSAALVAYRHSLRRDSTPPPWLANRLAWLLLAQRPGDPRALEQAEQLASYLAGVFGETRPEGLQTLAAVHAVAGRWEEAARAAERALAVARASGDEARARAIESELARYRARGGAASAAAPAPIP